MVIYLRHPTHGTKVAVDEQEAKADEAKGWERFQVGALLTPETPALPEVNALKAVSDLEALREQWQEKFGKKPHHKKSADTLRAELAA